MILHRISSSSSQVPSQMSPINSERALSSTRSSSVATSWDPGPQESKIGIPRAPTYTCATCNKVCSTLKVLENHMAEKHRYSCNFAGCEETFPSIYKRNRHYTTEKHKAERDLSSRVVIYRCHCGKDDERKDNHKRHLKSCKKTNATLYQCKCGKRDVT